VEIVGTGVVDDDPAVTLTLAASDAVSGMSQMAFSADGQTYTAWEAYTTSKAWTLSSGEGTKTVWARFRDAAGNTSPAATDTITLSSPPPPTGGTALRFDGVDDQGRVADAGVFSPVVNDLSIALWARVPTTADTHGNGDCARKGRYLLVKGWTDAWEWGLEFDKNSLVCFSTWQLNSNWHAYVSAARTLNDGQWHHYAVTYDYGAQMILYVDGAAVATETAFSGAMGDGPQPILVGARADGNRFIGDLEEIRLFSRALSAADVAADYNAGAGRYGSPEAGLSAGWHLDEGSGTTAADYSGAGRTMTLSGGVSWTNGHVAAPTGGPAITSLTASPSARPYASKPVTLSVSATGAPPLQYQFLKDGTVLCPWSTTATCAWTPGTGDLGLRNVKAQVKDAVTTTPTEQTLNVLVIREPLRPSPCKYLS
jgi:hypothetical protein